jgi:hypothetical protein
MVRRVADWQSATLSSSRRPAEYHSAIQQIANLRYNCSLLGLTVCPVLLPWFREQQASEQRSQQPVFLLLV